MELHQLRYLLAVVEQGSFTTAAERVRVAQSGVSSQIQKLERELCITLLDRSPRHTQPTREGEVLIPLMRSVLEAIRSVEAAADDLRGLVRGALRVGTVRGLTWGPLFGAVAEEHERHPGVDIRLVEKDSDALITGIRDGTLDVAIAAWSGQNPEDLPGYTIVDDAVIAVVGSRHPWARRESLLMRELFAAPLICLPPGTGARTAIEAAAVREGVSLNPRWEVSTPAFAERLAERGLGVAVVSETTAAAWAGVRALRLEDTQTRSRLGVIHRLAPSPAARAFLDSLVRHTDPASMIEPPPV